jgi:hypothetical protein
MSAIIPDTSDIAVSVADGAFDCRVSGDDETHDRLVSDAVMRLASENELDCICFAQASMSAAEHEDPGLPVLKLGQSAYEEAGRMLEAL